MTPTSFEFTVTMPGDARFVGAVRQLAAHAAGYAQLTAEAGAVLAGHVERAAEAAVEVCQTRHAPIELRFSGDDTAINVHIVCDAGHGSTAPRSSRGEGVTVEWTTNGSRHRCHIRQRSPA
jgi:hypothetical protein